MQGYFRRRSPKQLNKTSFALRENNSPTNNPQRFKIIHNPVTKKPVRLPEISNDMQQLSISKEQADCLNFTNMFLQEPQRFLLILKHKVGLTRGSVTEPRNEQSDSASRIAAVSPSSPAPKLITQMVEQQLRAGYLKQNKEKKNKLQSQQSSTIDQNRPQNKSMASRLTGESTIFNSTQKLNTDDSLKTKYLQERAIVSKELKKFRPQNSSLTVAFQELEREHGNTSTVYNKTTLQKNKSSSPKNNTRFNPYRHFGQLNSINTNKRLRQKLSFDLPRLQTMGSYEKSPSSYTNHVSHQSKLDKIIHLYDSQKKFFQKMRERRDKIQHNLLKDYANIEESFQNNVGLSSADTSHYTVEEQEDPNEREAFKKEILELSVRCEVISRSIRKK